MEPRIAHVHRTTRETDIDLTLNLDGSGRSNIHTGIGFFDHMLDGFTRHGLFDLDVTVNGDLDVDSHHSIEDTGIVLGNAIVQALGDKEGIRRYGHCILPMDETLVLCAIDLCGRPYYSSNVKFSTPMLGTMQTEMMNEFFYAVSYSGAMNLHFKLLDGINDHHIMEASFKAFSKALDQATSIDPRIQGVLSTKGSLG